MDERIKQSRDSNPIKESVHLMMMVVCATPEPRMETRTKWNYVQMHLIIVTECMHTSRVV